MTVIRMLADNYKLTQVLRIVHEKFPVHRPDGDIPVTYRMIWYVAHERVEEVEQLRSELNQNLSDLWITNLRQRLTALQDIYQDANRWVPKRIIEPPRGPGRMSKDEIEKRAREGVPGAILVYEKDTTTMLNSLKQAREELGVTAADKAAGSLSDLVQLMEEQRGLERTGPVDEHPANAVTYIEKARMLELPAPNRSKGPDDQLQFLDGDAEELRGDATGEIPGGEPPDDPILPEKSTPTFSGE